MRQLRIDFVVPVFNEEQILENNVVKLRYYLKRNVRGIWKIIIAENGSTDRTSEIAKNLCSQYQNIIFLKCRRKGRGHALKTAWRHSKADISCYMDADLSTDLRSVKEMINAWNEGCDLVVGSRHLKNSKVRRSIHRSVLSRGYNFLVYLLFRTKIKDVQCGFKAVNQKIIKNVLPKVRDDDWFFDTELVLISENLGYKIKEAPIRWQGNLDSKVEIMKTVFDYILNLIKLRIRLQK